MAEGGPPKLHFDQEAWISNGYPKEIFEKAANHLSTLMAKLDSSDLLYFYARFKQAKEGPCTTTKPGFFDYQGKQKWNAWNEIGNLSKEDAMWQYIKQIQTIDPNWNPLVDDSESSKSSNKKAVGPVMSVMANNDIHLEEHEKTIFDFIKEDNIEHLRNLVKNVKDFDFDQKDNEGLALLHWASDRGHVESVKWLIKNGANVNTIDSDGQTPLHYASSCGHAEIIDILLKRGALGNIKDNDGLLPKDVSLNDSIAQLLPS